MLIAHGAPEALGVDENARVAFVEAAKAAGAWAGRRVLLAGERPAFELSYWCGTCPFVFKRLGADVERLALDAVEAKLNAGLADLDRDCVAAFDAAIDDEAHLFEFVVPMVPAAWNDEARVQDYADRLETTSRPTAVAVSTLTAIPMLRRQPAERRPMPRAD